MSPVPFGVDGHRDMDPRLDGIRLFSRMARPTQWMPVVTLASKQAGTGMTGSAGPGIHRHDGRCSEGKTSACPEATKSNGGHA